MPFSLIPEMSRRNLMKTGLAAAAGSIGFSRTNADAHAVFSSVESGDRSTQQWIAFVSDTHIAENATQIARENNMAENLKKVVGEILREKSRPEAVLIDGDLALGVGTKGDYETLLGLLRPLVDGGVPVHLALGNHDDRLNFREVLADSKMIREGRVTAVDSHHVSDMIIAGIRFIILDSLQRPNYTPGNLGEGQRKWLGEALSKHEDVPTIIFVHHDPSLEMKRSLEDTPELYEIIVPRSQVKAMVFGHTHVWNPGQQHAGIKLLNIPAVAYNFTPVQPQGWCKFVPLQGGAALTLNTLDKSHSANNRPVLLNWR
jgi:3',5'-cyclic AMP phosphodiesterase CpdA